ncbi:hypothetical protein NDU88_004600 [Pleurodeles waltl]|uniref:Uncharacterized protein n=1 Tax=Pleurodeles waltl TaxID=8319 RepID=A0AAV7RG52_PLEWA|nr:hypothetical protein NDU88_004600 [Pleurodeles waltl]
MESFVEKWIKDVLQPAGLSRVFVVERGHRALVAPLRPGAPSRAIIRRLLNYKDLDCILHAARVSDKALYKNCKISVYPDYTNKVQNSRKGFMAVKAKARLKVLWGGKAHFFDRPGEVWCWLELWDKVAPGRPEGPEALPSGPLAWRDRLGDHMVRGVLPQGGVTVGWHNGSGAQLQSRTWRRAGVPR